MVALVVISLLVVGLIQAAMSGIYSAALYRYASGEGSTEGFDSQVLQTAFANKG